MRKEVKSYGYRISIHALREEGDAVIQDGLTRYVKFLSTPSARRATPPQSWCYMEDGISIHALREEGDVYIYCTGAGNW